MPSDRRSAILDAALTCFVQRGLTAASIEEVRAHSGASIGSIYHHFGGRDGLAGAVYVRALADYQAVLSSTLAREGGAERGVQAAVVAHLRWCLLDRVEAARFLVFCGDAARSAAPSELAEHNRDFFVTVRAWWARHVAAGEVRDLDPNLLYALWLGPAQEYARVALAGRTTGDHSRATVQLASGAWRALRAGE
ncbi:TetR/AcrR family transcriptional regulator [Pseudonocardia alni]|uniref:TetR/AcrR family transcriptional regulator n=1 Tax=Pseudonocardia alni TaxID=33907 RepID=UPI0033F9B6AD